STHHASSTNAMVWAEPCIQHTPQSWRAVCKLASKEARSTRLSCPRSERSPAHETRRVTGSDAQAAAEANPASVRLASARAESPCTPGCPALLITAVRKPCAARPTAAVVPAGPAPTMTTSNIPGGSLELPRLLFAYQILLHLARDGQREG